MYFRILRAGLLIALSAGAWGQEPSATMRPVVRENTEPVGLTARRQLNYFKCQLYLTPEQQAKYTELMAAFLKDLKEEARTDPATLAKVAELTAQLNEAQKSGDMRRLKELKAEMEKLSPLRRPINDFFGQIEPLLTPLQKQRLETIKARLAEGVPFDLRLKPREGVRILEQIGLTPDQEARITALQEQLRMRLDKMPPNDDNYRQRAVAQFFVDVQALLNPAQLKTFEEKCEGRLPKTVPPEEMPENGWDGTRMQKSVEVPLEPLDAKVKALPPPGGG